MVDLVLHSKVCERLADAVLPRTHHAVPTESHIVVRGATSSGYAFDWLINYAEHVSMRISLFIRKERRGKLERDVYGFRMGRRVFAEPRTASQELTERPQEQSWRYFYLRIFRISCDVAVLERTGGQLVRHMCELRGVERTTQQPRSNGEAILVRARLREGLGASVLCSIGSE